eukprot:jgi/Mesen1/1068/ME000123S00235
MHSFLFRANALLTFAITVLAVLSALASFTDFFHAANPKLDVNIRSIEIFRRRPLEPLAGNDEVWLVLNITADLRDVFTWNTKQLFVFICAEYGTKKNELNQISLWDRIIEREEDAVFSLPFERNKYGLIDQGNNLRGRPVNLTVYWNTMPICGALRIDKRVFSGFTLPAQYSSR